jgi:hypothetical protein
LGKAASDIVTALYHLLLADAQIFVLFTLVGQAGRPQWRTHYVTAFDVRVENARIPRAEPRFRKLEAAIHHIKRED